MIALLQRIVDDICGGRTSILPRDTLRSARDLIKIFITEPRITIEIEKSINNLFPDMPAVKKAVFLLRGLVSNRILIMTLRKRFGVQYGLPDLSVRDPIAVPYVAKGTLIIP